MPSMILAVPWRVVSMPSMILAGPWRVVSMPSVSLAGPWRVVSMPSVILAGSWRVVCMPSVCSGLVLCTQEALARSLHVDAVSANLPPALSLPCAVLDVRRSSARPGPEPATV